MTDSTRDENQRATIRSLRQTLTAQLNDAEEGRVLCEICRLGTDTNDAADPRFLVMRLLRDHDLAPGPGDLIEMPRAIAERVAEDLFRGPLGGPSKRTDVEARAAASSFFSLFDEGARFYSTWNYKIDASTRNLTYSGKPMLANSLESGLLVVDSSAVGCLLVGDED